MCHIDRLPNEILRLILSFVDDSDYDHWQNPQQLRDIVIVRWVSRRFRLITNELGFWNKDDVDITSLFKMHDRRPRLQARFIKALLNDDNLLRCLSRKSGWTFNNIEEFMAIVTSIPELPRNTRRVTFHFFPEALNLAIDLLSTFTAITELTIRPEGDTMLDLDGIVEVPSSSRWTWTAWKSTAEAWHRLPTYKDST